VSQLLGGISSAQNVMQGLHVPVKPVAGWAASNMLTASALSTIALVANRLHVSPFIPCHSLNTSSATIEVTTGVASALTRIVVNSANATTGQPDALLANSGDLDFATSSTTPTWSTTLSWVKGTVYWIGVHSSSTATLRGIPTASQLPLSIAASTGTTVSVCMQRTSLTFASGSPNPFGTGAHAANIQPIIRWTVA